MQAAPCQDRCQCHLQVASCTAVAADVAASCDRAQLNCSHRINDLPGVQP
jgi:hypothetical protein